MLHMWVLHEEFVKYPVCLLCIVWRDENGMDATVRQIFGNVFDESFSSHLVRVGHLFGVSDQTYHSDVPDVHSVCEQKCSQGTGLARVCSKIDGVVQVVDLSVYKGERYASLIQLCGKLSYGISKDHIEDDSCRLGFQDYLAFLSE